MTDNFDYASVLNLPETALVPPLARSDGTFLLELENESDIPTTPKEQVIKSVMAFDQLALIVMIYYKSKHGVPMLPIIDHQNPDKLEFYLENE